MAGGKPAANGRDQQRLIVVAAAIVEREGRYLIAQRYDEAILGGLWEFPGGKCRPGETLEDCLHRELMEELGVQVNVVARERIITHAYDHGPVELHFYRCVMKAGEPRPLGCQAVRWVAPHELVNYSFPPADRPLIDALASIKPTLAQSGGDAPLPLKPPSPYT